jgi:hypothetical protein
MGTERRWQNVSFSLQISIAKLASTQADRNRKSFPFVVLVAFSPLSICFFCFYGKRASHLSGYSLPLVNLWTQGRSQTQLLDTCYNHAVLVLVQVDSTWSLRWGSNILFCSAHKMPVNIVTWGWFLPVNLIIFCIFHRADFFYQKLIFHWTSWKKRKW